MAWADAPYAAGISVTIEIESRLQCSFDPGAFASPCKQLVESAMLNRSHFCGRVDVHA